MQEFTVLYADGSTTTIEPATSTQWRAARYNARGENTNPPRVLAIDRTLCEVPSSDALAFQEYVEKLIHQEPPHDLAEAIGCWARGALNDAATCILVAQQRWREAMLARATLARLNQHDELHQVADAAAA